MTPDAPRAWRCARPRAGRAGSACRAPHSAGRRGESSLRCSRAFFARFGRAARVAPAARGVVDDRVAVLRVVDVVVVEGFVAVAGRRCSTRTSVLLPPQPCSITIVGNGPLPVAGSVTSTSSGTPSKDGTRWASVPVGQKRTPFCGFAGMPERSQRGPRRAGASERRSCDRQRAPHHSCDGPDPHRRIPTRIRHDSKRELARSSPGISRSSPRICLRGHVEGRCRACPPPMPHPARTPRRPMLTRRSGASSSPRAMRPW